MKQRKMKNSEKIRRLRVEVKQLRTQIAKHEEIITVLAADHYKRRGLIPDISEGNISTEDAMKALRPPIPTQEGTGREGGMDLRPDWARDVPEEEIDPDLAKQVGAKTDTKRERARGKKARTNVRKRPV
jgi:hypothetical protein